MRELDRCGSLIRHPKHRLCFGSYFILISVSFNFLHEEFVELIEITFKKFFFEFYFLVTLEGFSSTQKIQRELKPQIIYVVFVKRDEIVFSCGYTTGQIYERNLRAWLESVHLNLHVFRQIPCEDVMLQRLCLCINKLYDLMMRSSKDLSDHPMIQIQFNFRQSCTII